MSATLNGTTVEQLRRFLHGIEKQEMTVRQLRTILFDFHEQNDLVTAQDINDVTDQRGLDQ